MTKVLLLNEDNHGLLDVFYDYDTIIDYLIQEQWLNKDTEINNTDNSYSDEWKSISEVLGEDWDIQLHKMNIDTFNNLFDGCFYIDSRRVYGLE